MEFTVEYKDFPATKVIYLPVTVPYEEMRDFKRFFMKLGIHLFLNGAKKATGISFIRYVGESETTIDMEICLEVTEFLRESKEIKCKELASFSGKYAVAKHKGSRDRLPGIYTEMSKWFKEQGLIHSGGNMIEYYFNTSRHVPEEELLTELLWPIEG